MIQSLLDYIRYRRLELARLLESLMEDVILWTDSDPFTD